MQSEEKSYQADDTPTNDEDNKLLTVSSANIVPTISPNGATNGSQGSAEDRSKTPPSIQSVTFYDERARLEHKIDKLREEITRNSIAREDDIEEYLKITSSMKNRPDNPQMARIRQHFEKKNRKYTQETEHLQKKLELLEQRLENLENGVQDASQLGRNGTQRVLQNVGHGIRRNLREMTGNVIAAPFDIAQLVKKNVFGSADNIPITADESNVGLSTFYESHGQNIDQQCTSSQSERGGKNVSREAYNNDSPSEGVPADALLPRIRLDSVAATGGDDTITLAERIRELRQHNVLLQKAFDTFKREAENEIRNQQTELVNSRFRIQHLEHTLNETMELHQNEVKQLKNDLNLIGARMDYQYNDRFKKIEEAVEAAQNRVYRVEASWRENSERLLASGHNMWNAVMLSAANIVVELLKITLYIISVVLDSIKPLTGTRKRAGIVVAIVAVGLFLWNMLFSSSIPLSPHHSSVPTNS